MKKLSKKDISLVMSELRRKGHKTNPMPREHYSRMGKISAQKRLAKQPVDKSTLQ